MRVVKLPVPTTDTKLLLKLLQLDLDAHPPGAPVLKVSVEAETLRPQRVQDGMFVSRPGATTSGGEAGTAAQVAWGRSADG